MKIASSLWKSWGYQKEESNFKIWYPLDCCSVLDSTVAQCKALKIWCDSFKLIALGYFPLFPPPNTCMGFFCRKDNSWKDNPRCCLQVWLVGVTCTGCFWEGISVNPTHGCVSLGLVLFRVDPFSGTRESRGHKLGMPMGWWDLPSASRTSSKVSLCQFLVFGAFPC